LNDVVLDASALLALLNDEPGRAVVEAALDGAFISAVNLSEVMAKLADRGMAESHARAALNALDLEVVPFDAELAFRAGALRPITRPLGLSLGDRACLALGIYLSLPVLTAERHWHTLALPISIQRIR